MSHSWLYFVLLETIQVDTIKNFNKIMKMLNPETPKNRNCFCNIWFFIFMQSKLQYVRFFSFNSLVDFLQFLLAVVLWKILRPGARLILNVFGKKCDFSPSTADKTFVSMVTLFVPSRSWGERGDYHLQMSQIQVSNTFQVLTPTSNSFLFPKTES